MMPETARVLVVGAQGAQAEALAGHLAATDWAVAAQARSLHEARLNLEARPADLVVTDVRLPDGCGLDLLKDPERDAESEYFLFGGELSADELLAAMRLGVRDVFDRATDARAAGDALRRSWARQCLQRHERRRSVRLRALSSRILRDRRDVRRRVELVCRDLVGAYQQLAEKVVALAGAPARPRRLFDDESNGPAWLNH